MQSDLGIDFYDPAMLARRLTEGREFIATAGVVPFCPVLRQGWELLRVKGVALDEPVMTAQPFLTHEFVHDVHRRRSFDPRPSGREWRN